MAEFKKIFKEKTANEYSDSIFTDFQKKPKKYQLIKQDLKRSQHHEYLTEFKWSDTTPLDKQVASCLRLFADTKVYSRSFQGLSLNNESINLATIRKEQLEEAKAKLMAIQPLVNDLVKE